MHLSGRVEPVLVPESYIPTSHALRERTGGIANLILLDRKMRIDMAHAGAPDEEPLDRIDTLLSQSD